MAKEEPKAKKVPRFEGRDVKNRELKLSGSVGVALALEDPHGLGDELVVIGTFKVDKIAHEDKKKILTRIETADAIDLFVVSDQIDALDLLQRARRERQDAMDALLGVQTLPLDDVGVATDAAIAQLTEEEQAKAEKAAIDAEFDRLSDTIDSAEGGPAETPPETVTDDDWEDPERPPAE